VEQDTGKDWWSKTASKASHKDDDLDADMVADMEQWGGSKPEVGQWHAESNDWAMESNNANKGNNADKGRDSASLGNDTKS
jgi:hypothetical protein